MVKINKIIDAYIRGRASEEEQSILINFLRSSEENKKYFRAKTKTIQSEKSTYSLEEWEAWHRIKNKLLGQATDKTKISSPWMALYKMASVIAIILLIAGLYGLPKLQQQKVSISANPGQTLKMTLPDSSTVILNSNTTLEYHPLAFMVNRSIILKGEAFFDIRKKNNTAFRVKADNYVVKVLGTRFNVNAYTSNKNFSVVLEEGKVQVKSKARNQNTICLRPGEMLDIQKKDNRHKISKVNTRLYTSWKEGLLYFYDSQFDDVINRVEKRYGAKFLIEDEVINKFIISTTIKDEPLEKVLDLMKNVLPIKINEKEGIIRIHLDQERYNKYLKQKTNRTLDPG
ncbi:FecR family protein [Marinilabilia sp.]|uniref:FecR family protein n=1 Tax=Marinilabilia sp. TaxID=2021252 RepID=UPI0025C04677|nr:FecR family protein [Marinilabilia sp.]